MLLCGGNTNYNLNNAVNCGYCWIVGQFSNCCRCIFSAYARIKPLLTLTLTRLCKVHCRGLTITYNCCNCAVLLFMLGLFSHFCQNACLVFNWEANKSEIVLLFFFIKFLFLTKKHPNLFTGPHRKHLHQPRKPRPAYSKTRWYNFHYLCPNISAHISHHKKCLIASSFFFHFQWSYLQCIMLQ